jgi:hypothetical protein
MADSRAMSVNDSNLIGRWGDGVPGVNDARTRMSHGAALAYMMFRARFLGLRFYGWVLFALSVDFRRFHFHVSRATCTVPDVPRWKLICHCHEAGKVTKPACASPRAAPRPLPAVSGSRVRVVG